ncbi:MAG TPA: lipopolysaccharide heptosyltransferase II [Gemmatimonadales bacterium]|jgi:heptosyltransferase-2|nr:lipopolysaccharide heptosyltransferase II [Gemmatimonadales bacterium]
MTGGPADRRTDADRGWSGTTRGAGSPAVRPSTLVIQTAFLGDVVLTTPLLSRLAERDGPVDVVTTPAAASLLEHHPAVHTVLGYDKHGSQRGWRALRKIGTLLRARGYHRVVLPHQSLRSAVLALWSGAPERIGFADSPAAISYTRRVRRARQGHEVERLLALAGSSVGTAPRVSLGLQPRDYSAADQWLAAHGVAPRFAALAPGSIWGTKRWPYYAELAAALDRPSVIVGGVDDVPLADSIVAAARGRAVSAAGALSLRSSAALIERASVLVSNDSAPLHLATAVGTPVVALFGPTVPEFGFGPRGRDDAVLGLDDLACRPCSSHGPQTCPLGHHRCMRDLSVDTVANAVATLASAEDSRAICPGN